MTSKALGSQWGQWDLHVHTPLSVVQNYGGDTDEAWAKPALIIMTVWGSVGGYNMILYLAALQGVPREHHEAAMVDGCSRFGAFFRVTLPLLREILQTSLELNE